MNKEISTCRYMISVDVSLEMQNLDIQFLNLVVSNPFEMWPYITVII